MHFSIKTHSGSHEEYRTIAEALTAVEGWVGGGWSTLLLEKALFPPPTLSSHLLLPHILSSSRSWVSFPTEKLHSLQNGGEGLLLIAVIHFKRA